MEARRRALKCLLRLLLESCLVASAAGFLSILLFSELDAKFVIANSARWMAASISFRLIMLHSRISSAPSLKRDANDDWFLRRPHRFMLTGRDDNFHEGGNGVPARIRQVPRDGSCLFHAIAAGVLSGRSPSRCRGERDEHPPMSEVIEYSSKLRAQAVDTLEKGMTGRRLILRGDKTISAPALVARAAREHGLPPHGYLSSMRKGEVWGGGPEIVALANSLGRPIILLEPNGKGDDNGEKNGGGGAEIIYLKTIAELGPSRGDPMYILAANQHFPEDVRAKRNNHFLVVFPSGLSS